MHICSRACSGSGLSLLSGMHEEGMSAESM